MLFLFHLLVSAPIYMLLIASLLLVSSQTNMAMAFQLILCISLLFLLLLVPSYSENPATKKPQPFKFPNHLNPTTKTPQPFGFLNHLQGAKKGQNIAGLGQLKEYLNKFGYLNYHSTNARDNDHFDDMLEAAIKTYQANYNLKITGTLDSETISKMVMPRCAVPDIINGTNSMRNKKKHHGHQHHSPITVSHYTYFGSHKWPAGKTRLTYWVDPRTTHPLAKEACVRAFDKWTWYTYFTFEETSDRQNADIKIGFGSREHGDGYPFDGRGGTLAHSFPPTDGRLHFDSEELWSIGAIARYTDVESVALHEIGHTLGLGHSSVPDAIMYPYISSGIVKTNFHADDVQGIRALYNT